MVDKPTILNTTDCLVKQMGGNIYNNMKLPLITYFYSHDVPPYVNASNVHDYP